MIDLTTVIRTIPDYPKPGIEFRDVTPLFGHAAAFSQTIASMAERYRGRGFASVAGVEARGFVIGGALAVALGIGFVPVRKKGKLPFTTRGRDYALEYGTDRVEIHTDAVVSGQAVLVVDDLCATGGTAEAAALLLRDAGAVVTDACFVVDLPDLGGAKKLLDLGIAPFALVSYAGH